MRNAKSSEVLKTLVQSHCECHRNAVMGVAGMVGVSDESQHDMGEQLWELFDSFLVHDNTWYMYSV